MTGWNLPPGCTTTDIDRAAGLPAPLCCLECELEECIEPEKCKKYQEEMEGEDEHPQEQEVKDGKR